MANAPDPPYMSVYEAYTILANHNYVMEPTVREIMEQCNMINTNANIYKVKKTMLATIKQHSNARHRGKLAEWQSEVFCQILPVAAIEMAINNDEVYVPSPPRRHSGPKSPLTSALTRQAIDIRVNAVLPPLQAIADAENTPLPQLLLIVLVKLCRGLGLAYLAKLLYSVFISMTDIEKSNHISIEKSAYMMVSQDLGRDRYTNLRYTLLSESVEAQPWYKVNEYCESITPERIPVIIDDNEGVCGYRYSFEAVCKLAEIKLEYLTI